MGVRTTTMEPEFFTINTSRLFDNIPTADFHQICTEHVNGDIMSERLFEVVSEVLVNFCVQRELRFRYFSVGSHICLIFALFLFPIPSGDQHIQHMGLYCTMLHVIPCISGMFEGMSFANVVFLQRMAGSCEPQTCQTFRLKF